MPIRSPARALFGTLMVGLALSVAALAQGARQLGPGLYAYISQNDGSSNSTFLVGDDGILIVDTGIDAAEGAQLLAAIRSVSQLPVRYIVNTHYHPDHQGGNRMVGPGAVVISTAYTRERTLQLDTGMTRGRFKPADITSDRLTLYVHPYSAEIYYPGKAHTSGDLLVYFPEQRVLATGDLFLNRSSPAMDQGDVANWIQALDKALGRPLKTVVPGHFEVSGPSDLQRFRDYLRDLFEQVVALRRNGATAKDVGGRVRLERYRDFRQYPQYHATFADNAKTIFEQLQEPK